MRVVYLTAGAGGMYCGSCLRDNALAAALIRQGRDVLLWPVYSPIRTDDQDVSASRVVFGGINVYLQHRWRFARRLPKALTRWLDHPALLRWAMRGAGSTDPKLAADLMTTLLMAEEGPHAREMDALIDHLRDASPAIVHLPNAFFVGLARRIRSALNVPVVCTLTGEDILLDKLDAGARDRVLTLLRERAVDVDGFLSVSNHYTAYALANFGVAPDRVRHVPLGVAWDDGAAAEAPPREGTFTIGYLARICPEKGLHNLIEAFEHLVEEGRDCRLLVAGYLGEGDKAYFQTLERRVAKSAARERVSFLGELDRSQKFAFLRRLDVLSVPTEYEEAKGLYVLEAMSQGVPVVQPSHGSFPELIESTGGGILHEPNNPVALADGLRRMMDDHDLRARLGTSARKSIREKHTDERMAAAAWAAFEAVVAERAGGA
ncbi:MAG TPA: glycosyltransferase family 4 protein [Phycisphaerae bacterium]|nr:glycosyltransferase family 4 protein [Phycisphaerae bacterium]HRW55031.1 glycosyltransferase family 4 protein [Phycisphaerae bacterium]